MTTFIFQPHYDGREKLCLMSLCFSHPDKFNFKVGEFAGEGIPVGSVEWIENIIGSVVPDYYPNNLHPFLHRKVWKTDTVPQGTCFIKPADRYKRFDGFVGSEETPIDGPFWCSEIVSFKNEWRYYVSGGKVLCGWWYSGDDDTGEAPILNITFPSDFYGAVDFGELQTGEFPVLVEYQHPYGIGWYGDDTENYAKFLIDGWNFLNSRLS
jgi:hypothetical protein